MNGERFLPPRLLQLLGALMLIASAVFWGLTGRESVLLVSSAMSLIGLGSYTGALNALRRAVKPPPDDEPQ